MPLPVDPRSPARKKATTKFFVERVEALVDQRNVVPRLRCGDIRGGGDRHVFVHKSDLFDLLDAQWLIGDETACRELEVFKPDKVFFIVGLIEQEGAAKNRCGYRM